MAEQKGPQVSYDLWLSDKREPKEKEFKTGTKAMEFFASRSTAEYQNWRAGGKQGPEPTDKYVYVSLTVFDKKAIEHLFKIHYKVAEARSKGVKDPRPNIHVVGELRNSRQYEGKNYEDVTVRDCSPLIWTPLSEQA